MQLGRLLILLTIPLLMSCEPAKSPQTYKVEFNSGQIYRVNSTGYFGDGKWINFRGDQGIFPKDSIKSITVETYE